MDSFLLSGKILKEEQITNPSTAWLLPSPLFWRPSEVLIETPSRVYTMSQMKQYFEDIDYSVGWHMRADNMQFTLNFSPPEIELHCLYGDGLDTVERYVQRFLNVTFNIYTYNIQKHYFTFALVYNTIRNQSLMKHRS